MSLNWSAEKCSPSVPSTERDLLKRKIGHMKFEVDWEDHNQRKAVAV